MYPDSSGGKIRDTMRICDCGLGGPQLNPVQCVCCAHGVAGPTNPILPVLRSESCLTLFGEVLFCLRYLSDAGHRAVPH